MSKTASIPPSASLIAGKYQLEELIGRGGMGSVWGARHVSLERRVAIKFIEKEYADSSEARSRFDNEARAAAKLRSKHLIEIHDHGVTDDGKPYIVMELLEGEPLDKRLESRTRLPLQEVARILSQVARGLQRAHDQQIIHRDLKPENIFLVRSHDEDEEIAKVLDFGIAKIRDASGQALTNSTKTGAVLGTPYYMSPEQARGLRDVDHRTDLWSLGVIVFKCVTGVLPFEGESLGDLLVKICTAPLPVPSHILQGLPPGFDAWFARALDRDPSRRFASATEMADALASVAGISVRRGPSSSTREMDPSYRSPSQAPQGVVTPGYGSSPHHSPSAGVTPYAPTAPAVPYGRPESLPNVTATGLSASQAHLSRPTRSTGLYVGIALGAVGALAAGIIAVVAFVSSQRGDAPKGAATQVSVPKDPESSAGTGTATLPIVPTLASAEAATVDAGVTAAADDDDGDPAAPSGTSTKSKGNGGGKSTKHVSATNATAPPTSAGPAAGATTSPPANKPGKPLLPPDF